MCHYLAVFTTDNFSECHKIQKNSTVLQRSIMIGNKNNVN